MIAALLGQTMFADVRARRCVRVGRDMGGRRARCRSPASHRASGELPRGTTVRVGDRRSTSGAAAPASPAAHRDRGRPRQNWMAIAPSCGIDAWRPPRRTSGLDVVIGRGTYRAGSVIDGFVDHCPGGGGASSHASMSCHSSRSRRFRDVAVPIRLEPVGGHGRPRRCRTGACGSCGRCSCRSQPGSARPMLQLVVIGDPESGSGSDGFRTRARCGGGRPCSPPTRSTGSTTSTLPAQGRGRLPRRCWSSTIPALLAVRTGPLRRFMTETRLRPRSSPSTQRRPCRPCAAARWRVSSLGGAEWSGDAPDRAVLERRRRGAGRTDRRSSGAGAGAARRPRAWRPVAQPACRTS